MVLVPKSIISIPFNTNGLIQLQFPPSPCRGPYRLRDSKAGHAVGGLKVLCDRFFLFLICKAWDYCVPLRSIINIFLLGLCGFILLYIYRYPYDSGKL